MQSTLWLSALRHEGGERCGQGVTWLKLQVLVQAVSAKMPALGVLTPHA